MLEGLSQSLQNQIRQLEYISGMHYCGGRTINDTEEAQRWCAETLEYIKEQRSSE